LTVDTPPSVHLGNADIDALGKMVYTLLGELWIVRDRLAIVEKLLEERGGPTTGQISDFIPDPAFSAELETLRETMINAVLGSPFAAENMGVDTILSRSNLQRPAPVNGLA
jgi:hypothetical protein